jgi:hypothetical protein
MSRLVVPVVGQVLHSTGDVKLRVELDLLLRDESGGWHLRKFLVDSGTQVTTVPAYEAKQMGLPMPLQPTAGATHIRTGLAVRSGFLRFRIDGMDATEYVIGILFLGDPATPPDRAQPATLP